MEKREILEMFMQLIKKASKEANDMSQQPTVMHLAFSINEAIHEIDYKEGLKKASKAKKEKEVNRE